jgi:4-amino-4-deoxy-L-arabinose transferase-like glycosyltransferase
MSISAENRRWRDLLMLACICMAVWGFTAGLWDIRGPDEGRYTQVAKELLQNHNWLHLTVLGQPYDQKPPLAFWFFAAMLWIKGGVVSSGLLRLPSAVGATVVVLLTYLVASRHWGRRAGLTSGLILASTAVFLNAAPTVELNMLYGLFIMVALYAWANRPEPGVLPLPRLLLFWLGVNAAFFVKGPLALLIIFSAIVWEAAAQRSWRNLRLLKLWAGIPVTLGLIAAWFMAEKTAFGGGFVAQQVGGETVGRLLKGAHTEAWWYYFPRFFSSIAPVWSLLFIPAAIFTWRRRRQLDAPVPLIIGWLIVPFLLLTIANGKRESYVVPLMPALALLNAWFIEKKLGEKAAPAWSRWLAVFLFGVVAAGLAGLVCWFAGNPDRYLDRGLQISRLSIIVWVGLAAALAVGGWFAFARIRTWHGVAYGIASVLLVGAFVNFATIYPAIDIAQSTRPLADYIRPRLNQEPRLVGAMGKVSEPEYHVYGDYGVREFKPKAFDPRTPDLPGILCISAKLSSIEDIRQGLVAAGYGEPTRLSVSRDDILVFQKPGKR